MLQALLTLTLLAGTVIAQAPSRAPDRFIVELDTTRGVVVIECRRAWAPHGADRFYELVTSGSPSNTRSFG
jgi:hypothetical protein